MIDTIIFDVNLPQNEIDLVKFFLDTNIKFSNSDGIPKYEFVSGSLEGSYDYRIGFTVKDQKKESIVNMTTGKKVSKNVKCKEYLRVEFSVSKFAIGHNLTNSTLIQDCIRLSMFRTWFYSTTGILLPHFSQWALNRLDISYNYNAGSQNNAEIILSAYKKLTYPRRTITPYKTSVYFCGNTTLFKLYLKNPEFKEHDFKRIRNFINETCYSRRSEMLESLLSLSEGLIRFEIEVKKRKLFDLGIFSVDDIFSKSKGDGCNFWEDFMKTEYLKVQKGATVGKIYTTQQVNEKIKKGYIPGQKISSDAVFNIWFSLVMSHPLTCNRQKKKRALDVLKRLGIPLLSTLEEHVIDESFMSSDIIFPFFQPHDIINNNNIDTKFTNLLPDFYCSDEFSYFERLFPKFYGCFESQENIVDQSLDKAA